MDLKMNIKNDIEEIVDKLREQRDELNVKIHLANMEVRDEWEELEQKWREFVEKSKQLRCEVDPAVEDIHTALLILCDEIKQGYRKIKKTL